MVAPPRAHRGDGRGRPSGGAGCALVIGHALCPVNEARRPQGRGCAPGVTEGPRTCDARDGTGVFVTGTPHRRTPVRRRGALTSSVTAGPGVRDGGSGREAGKVSSECPDKTLTGLR